MLHALAGVGPQMVITNDGLEKYPAGFFIS
jgi:hypothetical protein